MSSISSFSLIICVLFGFVITLVLSFKREITTTYNPGCNVTACKEGANGSINLAHITAKGSNDTLHYLISTIGSPTILIARHLNSDQAKLEINWDNLLSNDSSSISNSIKFSLPPKFAFAVVYNKLLEYSDVNDTADLSKFNNSKKLYKYHDLKSFNWLPLDNSYKEGENTVSLKTVPESPLFSKNGSLSFKFNFFTDYGRGLDLPHLQHSANSTQLSFAVDQFKQSFPKSRFALEMLMVYTGETTDKFKLDALSSLDDEHTPGVFKVLNWLTKVYPPYDFTGFMQWKPVCYNKENFSMQTATFVRDYKLKNVKNPPVENIAFAFFGEKYRTIKLPMMHTNVSFGLGNDGFYNATKYVEWTSTIGYGTVPEEKISTVVIIIIATGLGIPALLIILGGVFMCVKKKKSQKLNVYAPIQ